MRNTITMFKSSSKELKSVKCLTACSMLMALSIILGYMSFYLTESIRISFTYVPIAIIGILYGPIVGACTAGAVDLLNFVIKPGGSFAPGITLCAILTGFIYGFFLYRKNFTLIRLSLTVLCNTFFVDFLLKSYVLACLYGTSFIGYLGIRLPVQLIMLVLNTLIIYLLVNALKKSNVFSLIRE
ncbi:MAG: folate family ECF transporter S component [bacterium]|nr:folate family ECF transporter S component [bacterium]